MKSMPAWTSALIVVVCMTLLACGGQSKRTTENSEVRAKDASPVPARQFDNPRLNEAVKAMREGRLDEAEQQLQQQVQTDNNPRVLVNLAIVNMRQQNWQAAEKNLDQALDKGARQAEVFNLLGVSLMQQGKFEAAGKAYQQVLQQDVRYAPVYKNAGILFELYLQDYTRARQAYTTYIQLQGKDSKEVQTWVNGLARKSR